MAKTLLFLLLFAAAAAAQRIAPGRGFGLNEEAKAQVDSLAKLTARTKREQIACITRWAVIDTIMVVGKLGPARNLVGTDSVGVLATGDLCEPWQPVLHSHVLDNGWLFTPSSVDQRTAAERDVFGFLLSVRRDSTWKIAAYP
jgi:hypothetical protein